MFHNFIARRELIRLALGAGVVTTAFAGSGRIALAEKTMPSATKGLVTVHKLGPVTLHTYMAPEASALVTTHIVETPNELHVVDAQFLQEFASEARAYADGLGKPIRRVYLSHYHPDHILGGSQFADVEFVTSDAVRADVDANAKMYASRKEKFKDTTPFRSPQGGLSAGSDTWDGVGVEIAEVKDCEASNALTFHFPEAGLMIVQDLMYANAHAFPLGKHENWIAALGKIRGADGLKVIGAGHGLPTTAGAIDDAIAYLQFQAATVGESKDAATAIAALKKQYPGYGGAALLNFVNFLYKS